MHAIDSPYAFLLSDKEAESTRLRSEIGRLRAALTQAQELGASHAAEVRALQQQLQQVSSVNRWEGRGRCSTPRP